MSAAGSPKNALDGGIRARDAVDNEEILHAPPLIKAKLLVEMASSKAQFNRLRFRQFAKNLVLNTFAQDCYDLKREITNLNLPTNFVTVVYEFLQPADRQEVLDHLKAQVPLIKMSSPRDSIIVLSDVDDTLFQSSALMGGPKYPSKCKFPGVEKLYMELAWKVMFITARPPVLKAMTLHEFQRKLSLPNMGILCGKTSDLLWAAFDRQKAWGKMAIQKYHNFDMVSSLYPECKFVWFGDSGQGDLETGCMMMERKRDQMLAVYIHDIVEAKGVTPKTPSMARTVHHTRGIMHIDTFLDAALHLNSVGVLSLQSLFRVACATSEEWKELSTTGKWASEEVRTARAKEITADLEAVNMVLLKNGMATVTVCDTSLPEKLTPRISPRRKMELVDEAHISSLSELEQLKIRAASKYGTIDTSRPKKERRRRASSASPSRSSQESKTRKVVTRVPSAPVMASTSRTPILGESPESKLRPVLMRIPDKGESDPFATESTSAETATKIDVDAW